MTPDSRSSAMTGAEMKAAPRARTKLNMKVTRIRTCETTSDRAASGRDVTAGADIHGGELGEAPAGQHDGDPGEDEEDQEEATAGRLGQGQAGDGQDDHAAVRETSALKRSSRLSWRGSTA